MFSQKKFYQFINVHIGDSLVAPDYGTSTKKDVYVLPLGKKNHRLSWEGGFEWQIISVGNNFFRITNRNSNFSLVGGKSNKNAVYQYPYSIAERTRLTDERFHWQFIVAQNNSYRIVNRKTGYSLWHREKYVGQYSFEKAQKKNRENNSFIFKILAVDYQVGVDSNSNNLVSSCLSCNRLVSLNNSPEHNYCTATKGAHNIKSTPENTFALTEFGSDPQQKRGSLENHDILSDCINCGALFKLMGGGLEASKDSLFEGNNYGWCPSQEGGHIASAKRYLVEPTNTTDIAPNEKKKKVFQCETCNTILDKKDAQGVCNSFPGRPEGRTLNSYNGDDKVKISIETATQFILQINAAVKGHICKTSYVLNKAPKDPWAAVFDPANKENFPAFTSSKQKEVYEFLFNKAKNTLGPHESIRAALVLMTGTELNSLQTKIYYQNIPEQFKAFKNDWDAVHDSLNKECSLAIRVDAYFSTVEKMISLAFLEMTWATSKDIDTIDAENKQQLKVIDPLEMMLSILGTVSSALGGLDEIGTIYKGISAGVNAIKSIISATKAASEEESWKAQDVVTLQRAKIWAMLGENFKKTNATLINQRREILTNWGMLKQFSNIDTDIDQLLQEEIISIMLASYSLHVYQLMFSSRFVLIDAISKPNSQFYQNWLRNNINKDHPALFIMERQVLDVKKSNVIWRMVIKRESLPRLSYYLSWMFGELDISFFPSKGLLDDVFKIPTLVEDNKKNTALIKKINGKPQKVKLDSEAIFFGAGGWHTMPRLKMWMHPNTSNENDIGIDFTAI